LIESFKKEKEGATEDDKFGMIMDALEWVVWDYINENKKAEKKGKSNVEKALEEKGTIDLR
jgi:hypothetical protein